MDSVNEPEIHKVAAKLFLRIMNEWGLTVEQGCQLAGLKGIEILEVWNQHVDKDELIKVAPSTLQRLSLIAGVYLRLQRMFSDAEQRNGWIHKPNRQFQGKSALEWMLQGNVAGMTDVRRYLEDQFVGAYY